MKAPVDLTSDVGEVLVSEEQIQAKVRELGARISADYAGRQLTLVSVLKGSLPFMADLMRAITVPVRIDLMEVSSYGGTSTESWVTSAVKAAGSGNKYAWMLTQIPNTSAAGATLTRKVCGRRMSWRTKATSATAPVWRVAYAK